MYVCALIQCGMLLCVCVYVHVYVYVCVCVCSLCTYVHMYIHTYTCTHVHTAPQQATEEKKMDVLIGDQLSRVRREVEEEEEERRAESSRASHVRPWDRGKGQ